MPDATMLENVSETLNNIKTRLPVYTGVIDSLGPIFTARAALADEFASAGLPLPEVDDGRLAQGVAILADAPLTPYAEYLARAAEKMLPVLAELPPLAPAMKRLMKSSLEGEVDWVALAGTLLIEDAAGLEKAAEELGVAPEELAFAVQNTASPVLSGLARTLAPRLAKMNTKAGNSGSCPVCGGRPSMAFLSRKEETDLENLVGGGGQKFLHCGLCGHDWRYRRDACPACGNTEHEKRELLYSEERRFERVEVCHECSTYVLCIDLREFDETPSLDATPLGLLHLDRIAQERNFSPYGRAPWNTLSGEGA